MARRTRSFGPERERERVRERERERERRERKRDRERERVCGGRGDEEVDEAISST